MSESLYNSIATRYGFALPDEYRRLESRVLFSLPEAAHASAFYRPGSYLWLHDMEWYSLQAILDFKFQSYHDYRGAHVLCCHHDYVLATVYAPNFHTALYRQILDFCVCSSEEEGIDSPAFLRRWATDLAVIFPDPWCARLRQLADDPQRSEHAPSLERADISFDLMDTEIPWMQPTA